MAVASVTTRERFGDASSPTNVNTNFQTLVDFLNQNIVHRDGTVAFTSAQDMSDWKITNIGAPVSGADLATKGALDAAVAARWDRDMGVVNIAAASGYTWTAGNAFNTTATITFTAVAGRRYRAFMVFGDIPLNFPAFVQIKDGSTVLRQVQLSWPVGGTKPLVLEYITTASISGSHTWAVHTPFTGGPFSQAAPNRFHIEDVGSL